MITDKAFFEQYRYDPEKDLLGCGGFGNVYRAYDYVGKRYVAMKISQVKDIFGRFTLLNEVELSKNIDDHVNVARYEFGLRVKLPFPVDYAIMAYYEDGNLDMLLRKRYGQLTDKEYYDIVEGLLEGIGHLHAENVIHRDLKLANILMHRTKQGQWRPKIADFGLSRQVEDTDASIANSAIGMTIAYAAPEQIENRPIRTNVDLWAIGVIIYRLLTGEMPFAAQQGVDATSANLEMSRKITQVELPERLNTVAEPYQTIIRRCFVKDTKDRVQSASELLDIVKRFKPDGHSRNKPFNTTTTTTETVVGYPSFDSSSNKSAPKAAAPSRPFRDVPSVPKPSIDEKPIETIEPSTELEELPILEPYIAPVGEVETLIESLSAPKTNQPLVVSEGETLIESYSTPKTNQPIVASEGETLIELYAAPKTSPQSLAAEVETLIEPHVAPKSPAKTVVSKEKTPIKPLPQPKTKAKTVVEEGATLIEPLAPSQSTPLSKNKTKTLIGSGLVALLLSFGVCKMIKPSNPDAITASAAASVTPPNGTMSEPTAATNNGNSAPNNSVNTTVNSEKKPIIDAKTGKPVPVNLPPANNTAGPTVNTPSPTTVYTPPTTVNVPAPAPAPATVYTPPPTTVSTPAPAPTRPPAPTTVSTPPPATVHAPTPAPTPIPAAPVPPPTLLTKNINILDKFKCRACCSELSKKGTIAIKNFTVDGNGQINIDNADVSVGNPECKMKLLQAFKDNYKFSPAKNGSYQYKSFNITY